MTDQIETAKLIGKKIISFNREYFEDDADTRKGYMVNEVSGISDKIDWVVAKGKSVYYFTELDGSIEHILERVTESGEPGLPLNVNFVPFYIVLCTSGIFLLPKQYRNRAVLRHLFYLKITLQSVEYRFYSSISLKMDYGKYVAFSY